MKFCLVVLCLVFCQSFAKILAINDPQWDSFKVNILKLWIYSWILANFRLDSIRNMCLSKMKLTITRPISWKNPKFLNTTSVLSLERLLIIWESISSLIWYAFKQFSRIERSFLIEKDLRRGKTSFNGSKNQTQQTAQQCSHSRSKPERTPSPWSRLASKRNRNSSQKSG